MHAEDYHHLVAAIRNTAGALRNEADYVAAQDGNAAHALRLRARDLDLRAEEMECLAMGWESLSAEADLQNRSAR